ncbi:MAG TPA: hypothetical protein VN256_06340 [Pyrinomonadaceae bacterium]|nr:hypothetical protein [Pyrinomonadaceae bacterium]
MNSWDTLQTTCNADELNLDCQLQSLGTVLVDGKKATEAVCVEIDEEEVGNLTIEEFSEERESEALFRGRPFILTQSGDVLVFRE